MKKIAMFAGACLLVAGVAFANIVWGTSVVAGSGDYSFQAGNDPGVAAVAALGSTGHIHTTAPQPVAITYYVTCGPAISCPATVTVPRNVVDKTFTIIWSSNPVGGATISITDGYGLTATLPGSVQGNNIVWGT